MAQAFPETAHNNIDREKFGKNLTDIFGEKQIWCPYCGFRISMCKCVEDKEEEKPDQSRERAEE